MPKRIAPLLAATALAIACARPVAMAPAGLEWLKGDKDIPVVYRTTKPPWVDCPGNFGVDTWKKDAELWETVQEQRTESLRKAPPVDPALATADRFVLLARATPSLPALRGRPLPTETADAEALSKRFGTTPVLVLETTRWVLVGCFFTYQPWYNVRATLLETWSGNVLWRDACGGLYPPDLTADASPAELEANGKALYSALLQARAGRCASELMTRLALDMAAVGGGGR
jgi:hypothetical protein